MTEASRFYESVANGLGPDFLEDVQRVIDALCEYPELGRPVGRGLRRALLRKFPYSLFYAVDSDEILVVAVAHQRRRPGYWRKRTTRRR